MAAETTETGLDYFGARYFSAAQGRFTTPDWSQKPQPVPSADLSNPQSLNLYAYVRNNPLTNRDPDGHWCVLSVGTTCDKNMPPPPKPPPPPSVDRQTVVSSLASYTPAGTRMTVRQLANVLHNESNGLSGGKPGELETGKTAEANAILNNAQRKRPNQMAPPTGSPTSQDVNIMEQVVYDRGTGVPDPVAGRTFFGNSAEDLHSRPAGNGLPGMAGRQTVFGQFGPFTWGSNAPQYIYIYNDPGR